MLVQATHGGQFGRDQHDILDYISMFHNSRRLHSLCHLLLRQVVGWSMKRHPRADLVIDALMMALWRRRPKQQVLINSDQGIQYTCSDWRKFLQDHNLEASMSRRGNCHDNGVTESFFSLLKAERIKRKVFKTRNEARAEIFNYIDFYYNPKRRHGHNGGVSPVIFEQRYFEKISTV